MGAKLTRWAIFTILFSLVPIVASYLAAIAKSPAALPPLSVALEHGELYLLSSSFAAVGLGEVIIGSRKWEIPRLIMSGFSAIEIGLSALLFSFANNSASSAGTGAYWAFVSYPIFISSCIIATTCVALSELQDV